MLLGAKRCTLETEMSQDAACIMLGKYSQGITKN